MLYLRQGHASSLFVISYLPAAPEIQGVVTDIAPQIVPESVSGTFTCINSSGCFQTYSSGQTHGVPSPTNNSRERDSFRYAASYSNSIYGRADTVRPLSRSCKFFIRY